LTLVVGYGDGTAEDTFTVPPGQGSYSVSVSHMFPGPATDQPYTQAFTIAETNQTTTTITYHGTQI
jgi:hypothetical protein